MRALDWLAASIGVWALGCTELPGEVVGTYKVTMKLEHNSCGRDAVNLLDGHRYAVELRSDEKRGYWRIPNQPPLEGTYDAPSFRFESTAIVAHEGGDAGPRGCALRQVDVLTGMLTHTRDAGEDSVEASVEADEDPLDAGTSEDDEAPENEPDQDAAIDGVVLHGEHTFTISAVAGTDCSVALAPQGVFEKLPCSLRYAAYGVATKPF